MTSLASAASTATPETVILPRHIAIICDGNGRWAKERGMPRLFGHHQGYLTVREITRAASDMGIEVLTLYAFSTENWRRPRAETEGLMKLFVEGARKELRDLHANNVRMHFSGRLSELPQALRDELERHCAVTSRNTGMTLNVCLNYGGREEILMAAKRLVAMAAAGEITENDVTAETFADGLYTAGLPDPDLLIRTAGDLRISNYLLWQIAYTELYVTDVRWPEFTTEHLKAAIANSSAANAATVAWPLPEKSY
ncbi:MAG: polyprenyl diphosphate synthase [Armatimonas sp.]